MGNKLCVTDSEDCDLPSHLKSSFFSRIKLKWVEYFTAKALEDGKLNLELDNKDIHVSWKLYYSIFKEVKDSIEKEEYQEMRLFWHPSTLGYAMKTENMEYEEITEIIPMPDDYTDDAPSDSSEGSLKDTNEDVSNEGEQEEEESDSFLESSEKSTNTKNEPLSAGKDAGESLSAITSQDQYSAHSDLNRSANGPATERPKVTSKTKVIIKGWDPTLINPIFYGYSTSLKTKDVEMKKDQQDKVILDAETKAVKRLKETRLAQIEETETSVQAREKVRLRKIDELGKKYESSRKRRLDDYHKNQKNLPESAFRVYKASVLSLDSGIEQCIYLGFILMRVFLCVAK